MTTILPLSALPYIPSAYSPGDRLEVAGEVQIRDEQGRWTCGRPECPNLLSDADVRRLYTAPDLLTRLGLPLIAPRSVPADVPLPGRPVSIGESPFERDRPYLMCGNLLGNFHALTVSDPGPWGIGQSATTLDDPLRPGNHEVTLTATGVVWVRKRSCFDGAQMTCAFIPAELPAVDEVMALIVAAVLPDNTSVCHVPRIPRHAL
ncbi:hypothetical protein ACFUJY_29725 [Streptomyces sp. NPDC057249]|uniref:hypothetical protein n=1 Tax=Streptomyces sp. NPDC057249 TaxID=3346067 RepID=UPI00363EB6BD